jgi:hypothetical protein
MSPRTAQSGVQFVLGAMLLLGLAASRMRCFGLVPRETAR